MGRPRTVAAIDCGTNSTRLLVGHADPATGALVTDERLMRITRLGQGVDGSGRLAPEAIDRTIAVLEEYRAAMDRFGVEAVRMTATSAARDSSNRDELFDGAERVVGARPELLTGTEEGRLSYLGATADLDLGGELTLVVDIGGGSTELAVGGPDGFVGAVSTEMGCVRMTEKFLHSDPPRPEELSACLSVVDLYLDDVRRDLPEVAECTRFVGLAGTVSTVAAVDIGLAEYDRDRIHHHRLTKAATEEVFRELATADREERAAEPGLEPGRVDVIVGGCCILVSVFRSYGFDQCLVSEADILDGLALSLLP
jgi:exopolyphosphatase / guanosine-5'-triphosphate,3'-diphosphate pyrophosphatase